MEIQFREMFTRSLAQSQTEYIQTYTYISRHMILQTSLRFHLKYLVCIREPVKNVLADFAR